MQAAKANLRLLTTGVTGGMGNAILSFVEDILAVICLALCILLPVLAGIITVLALGYLWKLLWRRHSVEQLGP